MKKLSAIDGAKRKGQLAFEAGQHIEDNPYEDWRTGRGSITFSRGFWRAWKRGFEDARDGR